MNHIRHTLVTKRGLSTMSSSEAVMAHTNTRRTSTEGWPSCPTLTAAIPRLKEVFASHSKGTGVFPLFPSKVTDKIWKTVSTSSECQAAILVPLVSYDGVPSLLFTTRSRHLPTHASEVSFPGGHLNDNLDSTLEETAVREAQEELLGAYPWEDRLEILGRATPVPSMNGTHVTPIVAVLRGNITSDTFPGHKGEVEEVFCVSLEDLIAMETSEISTRFQSDIPVFPAGENRKIWGLTAVFTQPLLHKLFRPVLLEEATSGGSRSRSRL